MSQAVAICGGEADDGGDGGGRVAVNAGKDSTLGLGLESGRWEREIRSRREVGL